MIKVILTKGLPASGKTTWAKQVLADNPNQYKRINKDDLRQMLDAGRWSRDSEKFVLRVRDNLILEAISGGRHVIVDDTNLHPKHEARIKDLIKGKATLEIKSFTDIPIETCIERDLKREASVGEQVIKSMYNQFLAVSEEYSENKTLPKAIIVDVDGTLAHKSDRSPFDWHRVGEDTCNEAIKGIVSLYPHTVIIMSGRDGVCKPETARWLQENGIKYDHLLMREPNNNEKDSIIKRRLFEENVRGKYYVEYVLDDRNQVVAMWREMGLVCLQVAEGDF